MMTRPDPPASRSIRSLPPGRTASRTSSTAPRTHSPRSVRVRPCRPIPPGSVESRTVHLDTAQTGSPTRIPRRLRPRTPSPPRASRPATPRARDASTCSSVLTCRHRRTRSGLRYHAPTPPRARSRRMILNRRLTTSRRGRRACSTVQIPCRLVSRVRNGSNHHATRVGRPRATGPRRARGYRGSLFASSANRYSTKRFFHRSFLQTFVHPC